MPTFRRPRSAAARPGEGQPELPKRTGFGRGKKALLTTEPAVYECAVSALSRRAKTVAQLNGRVQTQGKPRRRPLAQGMADLAGPGRQMVDGGVFA